MQLNFKLYKEDNLIIEENKLPYEQEADCINFQIEKMHHTINFKEKTLERFNDDFHFYINFEKEKCTYELKSHHAVFDILVDQAFFELNEQKLEIIYAIETDDYKNKILIEFIK